MHGASKQDGYRVDNHAEHLVVLQVAGVKKGCQRECMYQALRCIDRSRIDDAIASLALAGVVIVRGKSIHQSSALERIDRLDMIGI